MKLGSNKNMVKENKCFKDSKNLPTFAATYLLLFVSKIHYNRARLA